MKIEEITVWLYPLLSGLAVKLMYEWEVKKKKLSGRRIFATAVMAFVVGFPIHLFCMEYNLSDFLKWVLITGTAALSETVITLLYANKNNIVRQAVAWVFKLKVPDELDKK